MGRSDIGQDSSKKIGQVAKVTQDRSHGRLASEKPPPLLNTDTLDHGVLLLCYGLCKATRSAGRLHSLLLQRGLNR